MVEIERMSINERRKYLYKLWERYRNASRKEKGYLLDEMQAVTGMHRKSLIRLMRGRLSRKRRSREPGRTYGAAVEDAVRVIARSLDYPCAERLKGALVPVALQVQRLGEVRLEPETLERLRRLSISTLIFLIAFTNVLSPFPTHFRISAKYLAILINFPAST